MVELMEKPTQKAVVKEAPTVPGPKPASPLEMMKRLGHEWDRLWDDLVGSSVFANRWPALLSRGRDMLRPMVGEASGEWSPRVEMFEREGELVIRAELPGLTKSDVKVAVTDELLTIEGERHTEKKEEEPGYFYSERSYGRFFRGIPLPEGAEAEKAKAAFHDGILEVSIPTPALAAPKPRQVEIAEG
jgi:HSP20 family protein